jgi:PBSX family phage terminase large subunit
MSILDIQEGGILESVSSSNIDCQEILRQIKSDLHPGQLAFVNDEDTEIIGLSAGYGAGKTRSLCAKAVQLAMNNQGFTGAVMEPTAPLIRDIWQNDFETFLENYGIPYTLRQSPLPEYSLHLPNGEAKILCRSFENWSRIIGLNLAWVLADEIDTVSPSIADRAFPRILARLRSGNQRQFGVASTPEGFRWMWNTFGSNEAKTKTDRRLIKMRTYDNPHLPADFITRLEENYESGLLQAYLNGEFCNITTGVVYSRFERSTHVIEERPNIENEPLRIGIDFNIGNTNAVIGLAIGDSMTIFDEINASYDTDTLAKEIKSRYPFNKIYIYPDASGGNRSTNATKTDIQILEGYGFVNQSAASNPPIRDRVNSVQRLFEDGRGNIRLKIHSSAKKLIECLELQSYTEKGDPDKEAGYDHMVDALGYICWRLFNPLHMGAGRKTGIRLY